mmetsp:Transcript_39430/g.35179  ORF Transcript_39430/g.35179 Transcript_39430/m.35179 type:complete len:102 (+) Transcript_39430:779-1084(+)
MAAFEQDIEGLSDVCLELAAKYYDTEIHILELASSKEDDQEKDIIVRSYAEPNMQFCTYIYHYKGEESGRDHFEAFYGNFSDHGKEKLVTLFEINDDNVYR